MGTEDRGRGSREENRPRLYNGHDFNSINLWLSWLIDERKLLFYQAHIRDKQSQDQIAIGLTHNYLSATEPQSFTEVTQTMKTRVEKQGPGSWVVFVNDQRHHELFLTRAAARREAKRQREAYKIDNARTLAQTAQALPVGH